MEEQTYEARAGGEYLQLAPSLTRTFSLPEFLGSFDALLYALVLAVRFLYNPAL